MTAVVVALLLVAATWSDVRRLEIPDWVPVALLAWALLAGVFQLPTFPGFDGSPGWVARTVGFGLGLGLMWVTFALLRLGGGDAKLLPGLGASLGPLGLVLTLFWTALAGSVLGFIAWRRGKSEFAYGPAILAGFIAMWGHVSWAALSALEARS